jgi:hypothetical protein
MREKHSPPERDIAEIARLIPGITEGSPSWPAARPEGAHDE